MQIDTGSTGTGKIYFSYGVIDPCPARTWLGCQPCSTVTCTVDGMIPRCDGSFDTSCEHPPFYPLGTPTKGEVGAGKSGQPPLGTPLQLD